MKYMAPVMIVLIITLITFFSFLLPAIKADEFVHPVRIDTPYVEKNLAMVTNDVSLAAYDSTLLFCNPAELNLNYEAIEVKGADNIALYGWHIVPSPHHRELPGVLILHDLNKSKLNELLKARAFSNLGFRVFLFDLRAHGLSEGDMCTFGYKERLDISRVIDTLAARTGIRQFAVLGTGLGANVAFQAAKLNPKIHALILQNVAPDLDLFLKYKLTTANRFLYGPIIRSIRHLLPDSLLAENGFDTLQSITLPVFFIGDKFDNTRLAFETQRAADSSLSPNKKSWVPAYSELYNVHGTNTEYYDRIAKFIISVSNKGRKTRFKRYAFSVDQ